MQRSASFLVRARHDSAPNIMPASERPSILLPAGWAGRREQIEEIRARAREIAFVLDEPRAPATYSLRPFLSPVIGRPTNNCTARKSFSRSPAAPSFYRKCDRSFAGTSSRMRRLLRGYRAAKIHVRFILHARTARRNSAPVAFI